MMTMELFISDKALTTAGKRELAERLLAELMTGEGAPESVLASARALTHIVVHQPEVWVTGGPSQQEAPRYLVRLTLPGAWNDNKFGANIIPMITRAIADFDGDLERLYREPHCVVQLVGLREHSVGTFGRVTTSTDITKLITADYRESGERVEAPEGSAIDPVCGMTVDLSTATITLDHDGTTYAFCAPACRKVFVEELSG